MSVWLFGAGRKTRADHSGGTAPDFTPASSGHRRPSRPILPQPRDGLFDFAAGGFISR